jgi:hypothetical protein
MTEVELELHFEWQLYVGVLEELRLKPTTEGFIKFRGTRWTKETSSPELIRERAKECEEAAK